MKTEFDPGHMLTYGYFRCSKCGHEFYGGGPVIHGDGCGETDYSACIYLFGPKEDPHWMGIVTTEDQKAQAIDA